MTTQAERIAALEVRVETLAEKVEAMNHKLDDLLAIKNKGVGVFWLSSALFGTSIVGAATAFTQWLRG